MVKIRRSIVNALVVVAEASHGKLQPQTILMIVSRALRFLQSVSGYQDVQFLGKNSHVFSQFTQTPPSLEREGSHPIDISEVGLFGFLV